MKYLDQPHQMEWYAGRALLIISIVFTFSLTAPFTYQYYVPYKEQKKRNMIILLPGY